jgi:hypothetical protein
MAQNVMPSIKYQHNPYKQQHMTLQKRQDEHIRVQAFTGHYVATFTIFWVIVPCSPYANQCSGGMYHLQLQGQKSPEHESSTQQVARHWLHGGFLLS